MWWQICLMNILRISFLCSKTPSLSLRNQHTVLAVYIAQSPLKVYWNFSNLLKLMKNLLIKIIFNASNKHLFMQYRYASQWNRVYGLHHLCALHLVFYVRMCGFLRWWSRIKITISMQSLEISVVKGEGRVEVLWIQMWIKKMNNDECSLSSKLFVQMSLVRNKHTFLDSKVYTRVSTMLKYGIVLYL